MPGAVATALGGTKGKFEPLQYFDEPISFNSESKAEQLEPLTENDMRECEADLMKHFI